MIAHDRVGVDANGKNLTELLDTRLDDRFAVLEGSADISSALAARRAVSPLGAAKKELGSDYPAPNINDRRAPLATWYEGNFADVPAFEKQMRRKTH